MKNNRRQSLHGLNTVFSAHLQWSRPRHGQAPHLNAQMHYEHRGIASIVPKRRAETNKGMGAPCEAATMDRGKSMRGIQKKKGIKKRRTHHGAQQRNKQNTSQTLAFPRARLSYNMYYGKFRWKI